MFKKPECEAPRVQALKSMRIESEQLRAETEVHRNAECMSLLLKTNQALSKSLELNDILQVLTDSAAEIVAVGSAAVYLLEKDQIYLGATTPPLPQNFPGNMRRAELADHPHIGQVIASGSPLVIPDVEKAALSPAEQEVAVLRGLKTIVYFPLAGSRGQMLGVYIVASTDSPFEITPFQMTLCQTLGTQASIAVENARLYQSVQNELSERKRQEAERLKIADQLRQAQKMESIGRLAGGVAHDLNNLLSPIIGYGELLMEDFDPVDNRIESLNEILSAGFRARDLVQQLLAFSRKQALEYKPVNLNNILTDFEKLLRRTIREDIEVEVVTFPAAPMVMADIGQIEQVIMNLAVNAQDAMPEGGKLTIEISVVELDADYVRLHQGAAPGLHTVLSVSDNGIGMDPQTRELLFEPFYSTKGENGTGLGLSTVYGIVKQHGGSIWVYSEETMGTTFRIYLPITEKTAVRRDAPTKTADCLTGSETVLIAEDDKAVRQLACELLSRQGYTVLAAEDGIEALEILSGYAQPVHLLLTDIVMPQMNGNELYDRAVEMIPDLKVLFMSGYADDKIVGHGGLKKPVAFIQKPFPAVALFSKIREILDQKE